MGRKNSPACGFTLVELIIVVSIISFLILLSIVYLRTQIFKGNDARRKADIKKIQVAVEEYEKDHDCYPLPQYVSCKPGTGLSPYMSKVPCDPITGASYYYEHQDSTCPSWYRIYADLENSADTDVIVGIGPNAAFNYLASSPNAPPVTGEGGGGSGTNPPGGGGGGGGANFYGCKGGVCVPISWDRSRPGPECDPNYQSAICYDQCGGAMTECQSWK